MNALGHCMRKALSIVRAGRRTRRARPPATPPSRPGRPGSGAADAGPLPTAAGRGAGPPRGPPARPRPRRTARGTRSPRPRRRDVEADRTGREPVVAPLAEDRPHDQHGAHEVGGGDQRVGSHRPGIEGARHVGGRGQEHESLGDLGEAVGKVAPRARTRAGEHDGTGRDEHQQGQEQRREGDHERRAEGRADRAVDDDRRPQGRRSSGARPGLQARRGEVARDGGAGEHQLPGARLARRHAEQQWQGEHRPGAVLARHPGAARGQGSSRRIERALSSRHASPSADRSTGRSPEWPSQVGCAAALGRRPGSDSFTATYAGLHIGASRTSATRPSDQRTEPPVERRPGERTRETGSMVDVAGFDLPAGWTTVNVGRCRGCGARVLWCRTPSGRGVAIEGDGAEHRLRCADEERMMRGRFTLLDATSEDRGR